MYKSLELPYDIEKKSMEKVLLPGMHMLNISIVAAMFLFLTR